MSAIRMTKTIFVCSNEWSTRKSQIGYSQEIMDTLVYCRW